MRLRVLIVFLMAFPLFARTSATGWCSKGGQVVVTPGSANSTTQVMRSYPSCTVTVLTSLGGMATLFSDNMGTSLGNPFTANTIGQWTFFADSDEYSITLSGSLINAPFTIQMFIPPSAAGITSLNGLTAATQIFAVGTSGTDFGISSVTATHTFNLPTASASNRGALSSADWTSFNAKQGPLIFTSPLVNTAGTVALTLPITIGQGGTGQITQLLGFNALSPLTTKGDDLAFDGTNNIRLGVGANNTVLVADSAQASGKKWATVLVACPTCNFSAAALTNNAVVIGQGAQGEATIAADTNTTHFLAATAGAPAFRVLAPVTDLPNTPVWQTFTVTAIANGINGCANANGCWQVNGVLGANKAAGLTQSVVLFQLPARGFVQAYRVKSDLACTGNTTLKTGVGTSSSSDFYLVSATGYDLMAAVSNTNVSTALPLAFGSDTNAAVNIVSSLTSTGANISATTAGCSYDLSVEWAVLP